MTYQHQMMNTGLGLTASEEKAACREMIVEFEAEEKDWLAQHGTKPVPKRETGVRTTREELAVWVTAYLDNGGVITKVPMGVRSARPAVQATRWC
jgi:hypothetical protein